ncbi:transposase [Pectobacterium carotovorum subsp. carotovorum]|nr:transposase [Pectobacterium carotovorum subsp. carotovorum]
MNQRKRGHYDKKQYTPEFKRRADALLLESGKSVARMAQEFDIKENTLHN